MIVVMMMTTTLVTTTTEGLPAAILPADRHPAMVFLARLGSAHSRRAMRSQLERMAQAISSGRHTAQTLPWADLRYQHTQALRSWLADHGAPATGNLALSALRGVLRECWRLSYMSAEDRERASDLAPIKGERLPAGRAISGGELRALFQACKTDQTAAGPRDAALLAVLYGCGLRRSEATALDLADYDPATGAVAVRHTKGKKQRIVYLKGGGAAAMAAWLAHRGTTPGPLFHPVTQTGLIIPRRLSDQVCRWVLRKRAAEAGITDLPSPHDMRRTFIGDLLDAGADISTVQKLAGHAAVGTTQRYDRRPEATKAQAAALLHVPY
jgi:site-specific recombinase XerD